MQTMTPLEGTDLDAAAEKLANQIEALIVEFQIQQPEWAKLGPTEESKVAKRRWPAIGHACHVYIARRLLEQT